MYVAVIAAQGGGRDSIDKLQRSRGGHSRRIVVPIKPGQVVGVCHLIAGARVGVVIYWGQVPGGIRKSPELGPRPGHVTVVRQGVLDVVKLPKRRRRQQGQEKNELTGSGV